MWNLLPRLGQLINEMSPIPELKLETQKLHYSAQFSSFKQQAHLEEEQVGREDEDKLVKDKTYRVHNT